MADTGIEWTDRVWNPTTGCDRVSPGCDHCYALTMAKRLKGMGSAKYQRDGDPKTSGPGFGVSTHPDSLHDPLKWRKPQRIFVNSMSDLFHDQVPDDFIAQVFAIMAIAPHHTFQVLTKRHARMRSLLNSSDFQTATAEHMLAMTDADEMKDAGDPFPLPNVWLGVSAENQQWADIRIPALLSTPAAVRFISAEPLLGPINLGFEECDHHRRSHTEVGCWRGLNWVIAGGESGPAARPMHPDWARGLRDQCQAAGVAFLFKQWGEHLPSSRGMRGYSKITDRYVFGDGSGDVELASWHEGLPPGALVQRVGKKAAGRMLDGRTWDQYPESVTA